VNRYLPRVHGFALRLSKNPDIAEDAAQETFVKAWKSLKRFDASRDFQPWIFAIARNAILDILRKRRDATFDDAMEESVPDDSEPTSEGFDRVVAKDILE